jgi:hypothetical protein
MTKKYFLFIFLFFSSTVFGWGVTGHLVIAQIAYDNLTPNARSHVDQLTKTFSNSYPAFNTFELMADWPDEIRNQNINAFNSWHFINRPLSFSYQRYAHYEKENVVWAISQSQQVLQSSTASPVSQAMFLAFLAHFVGDVHQPLHTVTLYSKQFPKGDQGGNLYLIQSPLAQNLHAYWDLGAGFYFNNRGTNDLSMQGIPTLAKKIEQDYPAASFEGEQNNTNPKEWSYQSYQLAKNFVYQARYNKTISNDYQQQAQVIVEKQTALAGYRLAAILNQIYG